MKMMNFKLARILSFLGLAKRCTHTSVKSEYEDLAKRGYIVNQSVELKHFKFSVSAFLRTDTVTKIDYFYIKKRGGDKKSILDLSSTYKECFLQSSVLEPKFRLGVNFCWYDANNLPTFTAYSMHLKFKMHLFTDLIKRVALDADSVESLLEDKGALEMLYSINVENMKNFLTGLSLRDMLISTEK